MMVGDDAPVAGADRSSDRHAYSPAEPSVWMLFAAGYLLVRSAAGGLAYGLYTLGHDLLAHDLAWHSGGRG